MIGANEYGKLFETGQYGGLYIESGFHARGRTFHIWLNPDGVEDKELHRETAFKVYGIIGGQPGWTEYYGWLHRGLWMREFGDLINKRKAEITAKEQEAKDVQEEMNLKEIARQESVIQKYIDYVKGGNQ